MTQAKNDLTDALLSMLPPTLTDEQRARFGNLADIVRTTTDRVPHARDEFVEPAAVFDLQIRKPADAAVPPLP